MKNEERYTMYDLRFTMCFAHSEGTIKSKIVNLKSKIKQ
jgi:hypothetical protein